jgi:putative membrane protein
MVEPNDPRVYFAAERTLLAWLRTSLAVMGFGFVVARFGVFLRVARGENPAIAGGTSLIGLGLMLLGTMVTVAACIQHMRFIKQLEASERPRGHWMSLSVLFGLTLGLLGLVLSLYLAMESSEEAFPGGRAGPEKAAMRAVSYSYSVPEPSGAGSSGVGEP